MPTIMFKAILRRFEDELLKTFKNIQRPFIRQQNWVRTRQKSGTDLIILAVYTDNVLPTTGRTKSGLRAKFGRLRLHYTF